MQTALAIAQLIIAAFLTLLVLLQTKGSGFSGALTGDTSSIYRSRRGAEQWLFRGTIGIAVAFLILAFVTSKLA